MNHKLLDAMEQIDDGYIECAQKWLDGVHTTNRHRKTTHRILLPLVAAVVLLLSTFTVAMAADPEFRAVVLTFFHIADVEKGPGPGAEVSCDPSVTEQVIGGLVKAQYIQMDGEFQYTSNNLLYQYAYDEELQDVRPARFWTIKDGQLVLVDITMNRREISVDWKGTTYRGVLDWFAWNGSIEVFHTSLTGNWGEDDLEVNTEVSVIPGRTDKVLLTLALDTQMHASCYYMLYDLATGQTEDFLAGTGVENLERDNDRLHDAIWARDMSGAILTCGWQGEDTDYYLDLETGTLTEIGVLTGVDGATAIFADDHTLLLYQWSESVMIPGSRRVTCWSYDLNTGTLTKTLNNLPLYNEFDEHPHGVFLLGNYCPWCVVVDEGGQTQVVNQVTGVVTEVENFSFSPYGDIAANQDGTKLLYFVRDKDARPHLQWSQLGVIDVEKGTFVAFDRDIATAEQGLFWLDDCSVAIRNYALEDGAVQGLYIYEF